jgi:hypothetical protein
MRLLRESCGAEWQEVERALLSCLSSADHTSVASVQCCVAQKP